MSKKNLIPKDKTSHHFCLEQNGWYDEASHLWVEDSDETIHHSCQRLIDGTGSDVTMTSDDIYNELKELVSVIHEYLQSNHRGEAYEGRAPIAIVGKVFPPLEVIGTSAIFHIRVINSTEVQCTFECGGSVPYAPEWMGKALSNKIYGTFEFDTVGLDIDTMKRRVVKYFNDTALTSIQYTV